VDRSRSHRWDYQPIGPLKLEVVDENQVRYRCEVSAVGPEKSVVDCEGVKLGKKKYYEASLINHIPEEILVSFEGPEEYRTALQSRIDSDDFHKVVLIDAPSATTYGIREEAGDLWLIHKPSNTKIQGDRI
jgi:hypothetical protein